MITWEPIWIPSIAEWGLVEQVVDVVTSPSFSLGQFAIGLGQVFVGIGQVVLAGVLAVITWRYVQLTKRMADEMSGQRLDAIRPVISVDDFLAYPDGGFQCRLKNVGSGPAFDVTCTVLSDDILYDETRISSLRAGHEATITVDAHTNVINSEATVLESGSFAGNVAVKYEDLVMRQWTTYLAAQFHLSPGGEGIRLDWIEPMLHFITQTTPVDEGQWRRFLRIQAMKRRT